MTRKRFATCLVVFGSLVFPACAAATTRQVVATGGVSSGTCDGSPGNPPCAIAYALGIQQNGDEYVIGPGTYTVAAVLNASNLSLHGIAGQASPVITSGSNTLVVNGPGAHFSDLEIDGAGAGPLVAVNAPAGGSFDNVVISATGPGGSQGNVQALVTGANASLSNSSIRTNGNSAAGTRIVVNGGTLTIRNATLDHVDNVEAFDIQVNGSSSGLDADGLRSTGHSVAGIGVAGGIEVAGGTATVAHAALPFAGIDGGTLTVTDSLLALDSGSAVVAAGPGTISLRNVTAISTDPAQPAILADSGTGGATINASNVIARGASGAATLSATAGNTINVDHSNFATSSGNVNDLGGNQNADPQFVNPASDFHLQSSSPALDAGTATGIPAGDTDLDGNPRIQPKAVDCAGQVDMGAYELTVHDTACPPAGPPTARVTTPASGASYTQGQVVDASYSCTPGANGGVLKSCTGPVADGAAIDTSTTGQHTLTVTATDTDGQTGTATSTYTVHSAPPLLSAARVAPRGFSLAGRLVKGRCAKQTAKNRNKPRCTRPIKLQISYKLNTPARVTITIARTLPGRLVKGRCVTLIRKNHKRPPCTRLLGVRGILTVNGQPGANSFTFNGRIGGRKLTAGSYRLTATPTLNGQTGAPQTVAFTITR